MSTILDEIVSAKRNELTDQKKNVSIGELENLIRDQPYPLDFGAALSGDIIRLIAEVKKASPSRGVLCEDFDPVKLASIYTTHGAAAVSVLTDPRFQGELGHIQEIKSAGAAGRCPVLRKDFIFDPYQIYEARSVGSDALLLIVSILSSSQLKELINATEELGMQCLVEIHDIAEMNIAVESGARVIGINNRDLRTFKTDLSVTLNLASDIPEGKIIVSESGINSTEHLDQLDVVGIDAVLVGEALVTSPDIGRKVMELSGK